MRIYNIIVLSLMALASITSGCKKEGIDNTTVTIVNRLNVPVTVDFYATESDYENNSNLYNRVSIEANDNLSLPGSTFEEGQTYYMDWYSADYYYNNWFNDDYPVTGARVSIKPEPSNNTYYLEPGYNGLARKTFLRGNGTETKWIAIGAYLFSDVNGYTNEWDNITVNERYRQITLHKGFIADYISKDATGAIVTQNLEFMVHETQDAYIEFKGSNSDMSAGNMLGGKLPGGIPPEYKSSATDTVMALFPGNDHLYMMIRQ